MENFNFQNATAILFGRGRESEAGTETARYGKKALLHYGEGSIRASGLHDRVLASLKAAGVEVVELGGVKPNPRLSLVRDGIRLCRERGLDFILAVGGGSVIDSAKAIAIGAPFMGDVWDFYLKKAIPEVSLPVGAILTIPAAGSESSNGSVITKEEGMLKRDAGGECMRPKFAIMNPELSFTLPSYQTACGAADIMAHVMERYFTNTQNVEITDRISEAVLLTVISEAPKALANREYDALANIMWAGMVAHNDTCGVGRDSDWATHMMEHELSGLYDVAHGAGLAVMFPAWMKYVMKHDVMRFAQFAVRVWGCEMDFQHPEKTALQGIERYEQFVSSIGMPIRFSQLGAKAEDIPTLVKTMGLGENTLGSFVKLTEEDIRKIYELAV